MRRSQSVMVSAGSDECRVHAHAHGNSRRTSGMARIGPQDVSPADAPADCRAKQSGRIYRVDHARKRGRACKGLHTGGNRDCGANECHTAEPPRRCRATRKRDFPPFRRFGRQVHRGLLPDDPAATARLRAQLSAWRDNDAKLESLEERSFLVKAVSASSHDLATLGAIGLAALDFIGKGQRAPDDWKAQQLAALQQIEKPKGQLLLMPAPAVQKLVEAATAGGACSSPN